MNEAAFGDGMLRLALGPSLRPDAVAPSGEDDMDLEDAYKTAFQAFASAGREIALFAPLSAAGARVALWTIGGELARGGVVKEAVFILPDQKAFDEYARTLAFLRTKK